MLNLIMKNIFRKLETYDITMDELIKKQKNGAKIIDVRSTQEYREGHIIGAINIPYYLINKSIYRILPNLRGEIVIYCGVGARSKIAYRRFTKLGYKNLFNLYGGLENWQ